jgi:hypothetical protein
MAATARVHRMRQCDNARMRVEMWLMDARLHPLRSTLRPTDLGLLLLGYHLHLPSLPTLIQPRRRPYLHSIPSYIQTCRPTGCWPLCSDICSQRRINKTLAGNPIRTTNPAAPLLITIKIARYSSIPIDIAEQPFEYHLTYQSTALGTSLVVPLKCPDILVDIYDCLPLGCHQVPPT